MTEARVERFRTNVAVARMEDAGKRVMAKLKIAISSAETARQIVNHLYELTEGYPGNPEDELQTAMWGVVTNIDMLAKGAMDELAEALEIVRKEL